MQPVGRSRTHKRRYPRVTCSFDGRLTTTRKEVHKIKVINISLGGVALSVPAPLEKGDKVLLEFRAVDHDEVMKIKAIGRVVFVIFRHSVHELGIEFQSNISVYDAFIRNYVNNRLRA